MGTGKNCNFIKLFLLSAILKSASKQYGPFIIERITGDHALLKHHLECIRKYPVCRSKAVLVDWKYSDYKVYWPFPSQRGLTFDLLCQATTVIHLVNFSDSCMFYTVFTRMIRKHRRISIIKRNDGAKDYALYEIEQGFSRISDYAWLIPEFIIMSSKAKAKRSLTEPKFKIW